jgi:hypothetical protein
MKIWKTILFAFISSVVSSMAALNLVKLIGDESSEAGRATGWISAYAILAVIAVVIFSFFSKFLTAKERTINTIVFVLLYLVFDFLIAYVYILYMFAGWSW